MTKNILLLTVVFTFSACDVEDMTVNLNDTYRCEASAEIKTEMLRLVNEARSISRRCGEDSFGPVPPISWDNTLEKAAKIHSDDMADKDFVDHAGSDGSTVGDRIINSGYTWSMCAENLYGGVQRSQEAVDGWLTSPGHCANIMNPELKEMGVACSQGKGTKYGTYWTQDFATPY